MAVAAAERKQLEELGRAVAAGLGADWTGGYAFLWGWKHLATVSQADGATLHLHIAGGRVSVTGEYPDGASRYYTSQHGPKSISIALDRGAVVLARAIIARFLPQYLATYTKALEAVEADAAYERARLATFEHLRALVPTARGRDTTLYLDLEEGYGTAEVTSAADRVDFKLTLPLALAAAVLQSLQPAEAR